MRGARVVGVVLVALALTLAPTVTATAAPPGPAIMAAEPIVDGGTCQALASGGSCTYDATAYGAGARVDVTVPAGVATVTAIVFGGGGAPGQLQNSGPGAGGLAVGTFDVTPGSDLSLWMGEQPDDHDPGLGWSHGGEGEKTIDGADGGAGGGSSAVSLANAPLPLLVAGGGGGAGSGTQGNYGYRAPGGAGGAGGNPPQDGQETDDGVQSNGSGGAGGNQPGPTGESADHPDDSPLVNGGGGGGGGGWSGGGAGQGGTTTDVCKGASCRFFFGTGGGGGGGSSWAAPGLDEAFFFTGQVAPGRIILIGNTAADIQEFSCVGEESTNIRTFEVPQGVNQYWAMVEGAGGNQGHSHSRGEGSGAVVSGLLDVTGIQTIGYSAGCSGNHGGYGVWSGGRGGDAHSDAGKDGGRGGGLSGLFNAYDYVSPLVIAGGGGGEGGDADCISDVCLFSGGTGGSGGGKDGTAYPYNGTSGGYPFFDSGHGGCADCNLSGTGAIDPNGGDGSSTSSSGSGGGGGGGAGVPQGGAGGGSADGGAAGGGGGAGGSFLSSRLSNTTVSAAGERGRDGAIVLIAIPEQLATLTVAKTVSGDADEYARGPYAASVVCDIDGVEALNTTVAFTTTTPGTVPDVPAGASCTVTETGTGYATAPAPPQTVTVAASGTTVTLDNVYETTSLPITLHSVIQRSDQSAPAPASLPAGDVSVELTCVLGTVAVDLPAPQVANGTIQFDTAASWDAAGTTITVPGVPVNSTCALSVTGGTIRPTSTFTHDGTHSSDAVFTFTAAADRDGNAVEVTNVYPTAPLAVSKAAAGSGTAEPGPYPIALACSLNGSAIALPAELASFTIATGAPHTVPNLPVGVTCESTETDRGVAVGVHYSPSKSVLIRATGTAQTVTNIFDASSLLVTVDVTGPGAWWSNGTFTGTLTCRDGAAAVFTAPLSFGPTGGHQLFDGAALDAGTSCSVAESGSAGATTVQYLSSADQTPSPAPVAVTLLDGGVASLSVLNTFDAAPLVVDKAVTGAGAVFANSPFGVTVDGCTFNGAAVDAQPGDASVALQFAAAGGMRSVGSIVVGASCDVREPANGGATTTTFSAVNTYGDPIDGGIQVTVEPVDGTTPTTAVVANDFPVATMSVHKQVTGAAAWAANTDYAAAVTCTFNELPVTTLGPNGTATLTFEPDGAPIASQGFAALEILPVGARCSAVETRSGGATTVTISPAGDSVVGTGGGTTTITNTFDTGAVTVAKRLDGNAADQHTTQEFHFEVACTFNGQFLGNPPTDPDRSSSFLLTGGQSQSFGELPVGASCLATEALSDATAVQPGTAQTGTVAAAGTTVTFANVFDVVPLSVRVVLSGAGAELYGEDRTFHAKVTCWVDDDRTRQQPLPDGGRYALTAAEGFTRTVDAPANSLCTMDVDPRQTMATVITPPAPVVTTLGDGLILLEAAAEYRLAKFDVSTIARGTDAATAEFTYRTECVWTGFGGERIRIPTTDPADDEFAQGNGDTRTIVALAGAGCAVTETGTQGAVRVVVTGGPGVYIENLLAATRLDDAAARTAVFDNYLPGVLPVTGAEVRWTLATAIALLVAGLLLLLLHARRRRSA